MLSSHILADVQEVCDTVGILRAGRLLFQGRWRPCWSAGPCPAYRVHLRAAGRAGRRGACAARSGSPLSSRPRRRWLRVGVRSLAEAEQHLAAVLAGCGARVVSLAPEAADLEDVFLELTS